MTLEEADAGLAEWRAMTEEQQEEDARSARWTLSDWLYWMNPDNRTWSLGQCGDGMGNVRIVVLKQDFQAPLGSLHWLLRAAGADDVTVG